MKKKSKFIAFILSFLPGLSHVYVGYKERAIIFFGLFFGAIVSVTGLNMLAHSDRFFILLVFTLPLIWFISMVDAVSLTERRRYEHGEEEEKEVIDGMKGIDGDSWFNLSNKKLVTVALSMIPGAGHMYLGLQNRGLALMTFFFFSAFLMGWLRMSLFIFFLPVIWFYSLFDAFHRVENEDWENESEAKVDEAGFQLISWFNKHPQWTGWALILLGCIVLFERIISPLLTWQIRNYLQTGIVALILIGGGVKLLLGSKQGQGNLVDQGGQQYMLEEMPEGMRENAQGNAQENVQENQQENI